MIVCPKCGRENPEGAIKCAGCRINLEWALANAEYSEEQAAVRAAPESATEPPRVELGAMKWWAIGFGIVTFVGLGAALAIGYAEIVSWYAPWHGPWVVYVALAFIALGVLGLTSVWVAHLTLSPGAGRLTRVAAIAFGILTFMAVEIELFNLPQCSARESCWEVGDSLSRWALGMGIVGFLGMRGIRMAIERSLRSRAIGFVMVMLSGLAVAASALPVLVDFYMHSDTEQLVESSLFVGVVLLALGFFGLISVGVSAIDSARAKREDGTAPEPVAKPSPITLPDGRRFPKVFALLTLSSIVGSLVLWASNVGITTLMHAEWVPHTTADGLADNTVECIAAAPDGVLWFGTRGYGVSRFDGEVWKTYTTEDGLASNCVESIAVAPDWALWFGTREGASRFDGEAWKTYTTEDGLANNYVESIAVAPDWTLWFGTREGASRFDGEKWSNYLAGRVVRFITVAPDGALWFGTRGGVSHFDGETWNTYTTEDGLASNEVNSIAVAPDGGLWFGTGSGVSRFDGEEWTTYTTEDGLAAGSVRSIAVGLDGVLWFGTLLGVCRFDGQTWTTYTEDDGLVDNFVSSIAVAPDGGLWFGTYGGVSRFDGESWTTYTTRNGLGDNKVAVIAVAPDGLLWFGFDTWGDGVSRYLPPD